MKRNYSLLIMILLIFAACKSKKRKTKLLKFQKMIQPLHFQHGLLQVKIKQMTLIQLNLKDIKRAALMQF